MIDEQAMAKFVAIVERVKAARQVLPFVDQRVVLKRITSKVERAAERMGWLPASGTQAVVRCGGRVNYVKELVN